MSLIVFDSETLDALARDAQACERKRVHRNLHSSLQDQFQRMLVAMEPDSYVPPHRHMTPAKPELITALRGCVAILIFDDVGQVTQVVRCEAGGSVSGCDIPPGIWHSIVSLQTGSVFLEAKPGPYEKLIPNDFGSWAPSENDANACEYLKKLHENASVQTC